MPARSIATGEIADGGPEGGRGPRNPRAHPQAGGDRAPGGHRRRVPPRLLAFRLPRASRRRHLGRGRFGHEVQGRRRHRRRRCASPARSASPDHPMLEHFRFLEGRTRERVPKMTIPGPSMLHYRGGRKMMNMGVYPEMDDFYADLGAAYAKAVHAFYDAGCRYLQLDDISFAYLCDPEQREMLRQRGDDPEQATGNLCRHGPGGAEGQACRPHDHDASLPRQFPLDLHRLGRLRAGRRHAVQRDAGRRLFHGMGHRPRRRLRAAASSCRRASPSCSASSPRRPARSRSKDDIKRRIEEATKYVDLDQLCLSPQCGFASTEEGNFLAEDEQWAKLRLIVEIAEEVWG